MNPAIKQEMPRTGFEPAAYCLEGSRSIQAELPGRFKKEEIVIFKMFLSY